MLVNLQGKPSTWHEVDLYLEHYNRDLKEQIKARRTSTYTTDFLFTVIAQSMEFAAGARSQVETSMSHVPNNEHSSPRAVDNIFVIASQLYKDSIVYRKGRKSPFMPPSLMKLGLENILQQGGSLDKFNAKVIQNRTADMLQLSGSAVPVEDMEDLDELDMFYDIDEELASGIDGLVDLSAGLDEIEVLDLSRDM